MPKHVREIASDLNELLRKHGSPVMTFPWPKFYEICERDRIKSAFQDDLEEEASGHFQLIIAYGRNAVVVCHDRNFQPAKPS